jgi:hypothetical protein
MQCPRLASVESENIPTIFLMIRSAHSTPDAIGDLTLSLAAAAVQVSSILQIPWREDSRNNG